MTQALSIKKEDLVSAIETGNATSLDLTVRENQVLIYNAIQTGTTHSLDDVINSELNIVNFYVENTKGTDDNGEVVHQNTLIFILDNGETVGTTSGSTLTNFKTLVNIFGVPSENNTLKVRPVKKKSQSSKYSYTILEAVI